MCKHTTLSPIYNIRIMRQTYFITKGMRELLIPQIPLREFTLSDCKIPDIKEINFFTLNTFPHIGDLVMIQRPNSKILIKVRSIGWKSDNFILVSGNIFEPEDIRINLVAPIIITRNILETLGFKFDSKYGKFRLRLHKYPDIVLWEDTYGVEENWWYVKDMKPIRYVHELQAIFRVHRIDKSLEEGKLFLLDDGPDNPPIFK